MQSLHSRALSIVCSLLILGACQSSASSDGAAGFGDQEIDLTTAHVEATTTKGWLNLKTLEIGVASATPDADEMIIDGLLVGWRFIALGNVRGQIQAPPVMARCRRIWVVLEDRSIVEQKDGALPPTRTYLPGYLDPETSLFYPQSAQIVRVEAPVAAEQG